ncbi:glycosyltransferase [Polaromonas sp. SM01]|uniref:glycosyltransferase n=1 Tax=Polaromonas sp. SM01 TaxID=3085630 RepID=UPI002981A4A1|nr:glycosyltransferase [Polaromonas sp. SM01]MDW5443945.1 glycosyltransferase [Polaromonas sp. SM01]
MATVPFAVNVFLSPQVKRLSRDYDVTILANGVAGDLIPELSGIRFVPLDIERKIALGQDVATFFRLWRFFRVQRFDAVHSIMPKAGLLAMMAAKAAGIPFRFHTFTGQVWATQRGIRKALLKTLDGLMALCATRVFADSYSQRSFLVEQKVVAPARIGVLADGSAAGVDMKRFSADQRARLDLRRCLQIPENDVVFLFVGRLTRDKGLLDLAQAFTSVATVNEHVHLMVVGPDEEGLGREVARLAEAVSGRVHMVGFTGEPERYMRAADILCLPSYREGFGSVIIEAAAVGLPAIASRIYGVTDAVEEGVTGILHRPAVIPEIADAMALLALSREVRLTMGEAARTRVAEKYSEERVVSAFADFYQAMLGALPR